MKVHETREKSPRGGVRSGAGRPSLGRTEQVKFRFTPEERQLLDQVNVHEWGRELLIKHAKRRAKS